MTPDAIVRYLEQHPEFFEQQAEFLAKVVVPHPYGGRAISIGERQVLALREKTKQLEGKLRELIEFGEQNDAIGEKLHRLTLTLLKAADVGAVIEGLYLHLREDFAVPHTVLRLWPEKPDGGRPEFAEVSAESRDFVAGLAHPQCGAHARADTAGWFGGQAALLKSFAYVPLKREQTIGCLALASEDPQRFYPEMGTLYLQRLGEITTGALTRCLG
jgi:uncharacterized protein YigA (DUF484 family)